MIYIKTCFDAHSIGRKVFTTTLFFLISYLEKSFKLKKRITSDQKCKNGPILLLEAQSTQIFM